MRCHGASFLSITLAEHRLELSLHRLLRILCLSHSGMTQGTASESSSVESDDDEDDDDKPTKHFRAAVRSLPKSEVSSSRCIDRDWVTGVPFILTVAASARRLKSICVDKACKLN